MTEVTFTHNNQEYSFTIYPTEPDWWTSVGDFDIHYCEDYNEVCVYKVDTSYNSIHTQKIKEDNQ